MKIKALIGIDKYSLMVCHYSGNLYHLSIIDQENILYNFEGVYSSLNNAVDRGRSVIKSLGNNKHV